MINQAFKQLIATLLEQPNDLLIQIIWSMPGFMYIKDNLNQYVACNQHFLNAIGCVNINDIIGKNDQQLNYLNVDSLPVHEDILSGLREDQYSETSIDTANGMLTFLLIKHLFTIMISN